MSQEKTESNIEFAAKTLLELLSKETLAPILKTEDTEKVKAGLVEALQLDKDKELLKELKLTKGDGEFIPLKDGKDRTDRYTKLANGMKDPVMKKLFDITKFKVNATHVRTLIDIDEEPGKKASSLLIYPGQRSDGTYTMVLAAGDKTGKTIKDKGDLTQVLDEIDPCKPCPRLEE